MKVPRSVPLTKAVSLGLKKEDKIKSMLYERVHGDFKFSTPCVRGFLVTSFVQVKAIVLPDHRQSPASCRRYLCSYLLEPIQ